MSDFRVAGRQHVSTLLARRLKKCTAVVLRTTSTNTLGQSWSKARVGYGMMAAHGCFVILQILLSIPLITLFVARPTTSKCGPSSFGCHIFYRSTNCLLGGLIRSWFPTATPNSVSGPDNMLSLGFHLSYMLEGGISMADACSYLKPVTLIQHH